MVRIKKSGLSSPLRAVMLARTAGSMLPLYREFVRDRQFSRRWSQAVKEADLDTLLLLFQEKVPFAVLDAFSTNGIGFFADFSYPAPLNSYTNATSIIPGTAQFTFSSTALRRISTAIVPLYRKLSTSRLFARHAADAVKRGDDEKLDRLLRPYVRSRFLVDIQIKSSGFQLSFKFPGSNLIYQNKFFFDKLP
ncbi:hypothetical protein [Paenibacillus herberti]|uniref:Uncharacterized protein n=1 Tax=Paenibacillus herberti TaxID=1619309 RepID=A0A229P329_9BACL|nr:hypothetical protein [Paenibacillus herberti]OXM16461.1 hypothetical protein CGZ75_07250 [Paenibacillus herberti]